MSAEPTTRSIDLKVREFFPAHEPRETDPHYHLFNEARRKLKAAGKLVCWICGQDEAAAGAPIELHHAVVEYALANGIDIVKFAECWPEFDVTDEESFLRFVESEGNLLPLCVDHHRGIHGIHSILYPAWIAQRAWGDGLPAPEEAVQ